MKAKYLLFGILLILLTVTAVLVQADSNRNFRAHLSGSNEVPANDSRAQGQAIFQVSKDGTSMHYTLIVANIEDAFASHIHCGITGQNGPVGVTLYSGPTATVNGILAEGTITAPNPGNACGWSTLDEVISAMQSGGAYVNVHTNGHQGGEIRGQIH